MVMFFKIPIIININLMDYLMDQITIGINKGIEINPEINLREI